MGTMLAWLAQLQLYSTAGLLSSHEAKVVRRLLCQCCLVAVANNIISAKLCQGCIDALHGGPHLWQQSLHTKLA